MSNPPGPGETTPSRRIEEGDPVLYYDTSVGRERGIVVSVDHASDLQLAGISIYSDQRTEADVPFEHPDRGYLYESVPSDGGPLGG